MSARRINGFSASILVNGVPLNTSGIIIDRKEQTMESYIQARGGQPFIIAWGCRETDLASRGDVFVDGVWVGYAYIDPTATSLHGEEPGRAETSKAGELATPIKLATNGYVAQLASEGWVRQCEMAPRQLAFDANALRKVEEVEMAASASLHGAGAEGFGATGHGETHAPPRTVIDEGRTNGGEGEVRLVISRLGRPRLSGNNLEEDVTMGTSSKPRTDNVVLEKLATFTFKYRSKEFLSKMDLFQRPCLDMDRIHEKNTLNEMLSETLRDSQVQSTDASMSFDNTTFKAKAGKGKGQAVLHRSQNIKATIKRYQEAERRVLAAQKRERRERGIVARAAKREAYAASLTQAQEQVTQKREKAKEVQVMSMDVDEDNDLETEEVELQDESPIETAKLSRKTRRTYRVNGLRLRSRMIRRKDKIEQARWIGEDMTVL